MLRDLITDCVILKNKSLNCYFWNAALGNRGWAYPRDAHRDAVWANGNGESRVESSSRVFHRQHGELTIKHCHPVDYLHLPGAAMRWNGTIHIILLFSSYVKLPWNTELAPNCWTDSADNTAARPRPQLSLLVLNDGNSQTSTKICECPHCGQRLNGLAPVLWHSPSFCFMTLPREFSFH